MRAFLLAAGFGTRLWPLSDQRAKPAFPFLGSPLIVHVARRVIAAGIRDIWVNTHYLPETVRSALTDAHLDADFHFVHEPEILGTGGALVNIREAVGDDDLLVVNAKIVTEIDFAEVMNWHRQQHSAVTMVTVANTRREQFSHVVSTDDGRFQGIVQMSQLDRVAQPVIFTGIQVLAPEFFIDLPPPGFSDTIKDIYPLLDAHQRKISVMPTTGQWAEFSTVRRYRDLHLQATAGQGHADVSARLAGQVQRSVIWPNVNVAAGSSLDGCVVGADVAVPSGLHLVDQAVVRATAVREPTKGKIVGDLFVAPIA